MTTNPITSSQQWALIKNLVADPANTKYKEALDQIESKINEYMNLINNLQIETKKLKEQAEENSENILALSEALIDVKKELDNQRKLRIIADCNALSNTFLVYGIEYHAKAYADKRNEQSVETREQFKKKMEQIKVNMIELGSFDAYRLPPKERTDKDGKKYLSDGIKIVLLNQRGKQLIYSSLKAHGKNISNFKIQQVIPRELIPIKKTMDKIAKTIRDTAAGTKTRILCARGEITLATKDLNEATFTKIGRKDLDDTVKSMMNKGVSFNDEELNTLGITPIKRKRDTHIPPTNQAKKTK